MRLVLPSPSCISISKMHLTSAQIFPFLIAALVVWSVYRRLRRSFGKQRVMPVSMGIRIGILLLVGALLLPSALRSSSYLEALAIGAVAGIALAWWGASRTRYLREAGQMFYVPHTYTGLAVTLLFLGRLVYRGLQIYGLQNAAHGAASGSAPASLSASMVSSPSMVGLFYVLVGYYVCYYSAVLWKSKHLTAEELAVEPAPIPQ
jgi:hypothetical protein